jgi:uncharacterized membrane protein YvlD (DUF360 family)
MKPIKMDNILLITFLTGFFGDILLQLGDKLGLGGPTGWGLRDYFKLHGAAESACIAGGMMTLFYILVLPIFGKLTVTQTIIFLAIYGIVLDLLFRELVIFKTLDGYYRYFNYFWSAVWGAIPLILPYLIKIVIATTLHG